MKVNFEYDPQAKETEYQPLPAGTYRVCIESMECKPNKANNGEVVHVKLAIQDRGHQGKSLFDFLNIFNPNKQAEGIGRARFSQYCQACGFNQAVADTDDLLGIPFYAKIGIDKKDTSKNRIVKITRTKEEPKAGSSSWGN